MNKFFFNYTSLLVFLLSGTNIIRCAEQQFSHEAQFKVAIQSGNEPLVKALIEENIIRVNTMLGCAKTSPLQWAAQHRQIGIATFLLERQAEVNYQIPLNKQTALHIAASKNDIPMATLLLQHKANIDIPDITGFKPSQSPMIQAIMAQQHAR